MTSNSTSDRIAAMHGAVLGALVGDAAGGILEFMGRAPTRSECEEALFGMPGGGVFNLAPGQFTDDGEMTVTLLRALSADQGRYDPHRVAMGYVEWAASQPFDIGVATSNALRQSSQRAAAEVAEPIHTRVLAQALAHNRESKTNGSLMRASPMGIVALHLDAQEAAEMAQQDARLTHPNDVCQHSTAAYVLALRHLILNPGDGAGAFEQAYAYALATSEEVAQWLTDADLGALPPAHPKAGFVRIAFTHAFHHLTNSRSFADALLQTLQLGGDTDTNACIVGGLMGALHGVDAIPRTTLDAVLHCDTQHGQPRPERYAIAAVMDNLRDLCAHGAHPYA